EACATLSPSSLPRSLSRRTRTRTSTPRSSRHRVTAAPTNPVEPVTSAFITFAPTLPRRYHTRPPQARQDAPLPVRTRRTPILPGQALFPWDAPLPVNSFW